MRLISQLIKGISRVLQKLIKYFNGIIISTFFVPPAIATPVISCLNLKEVLLLLAWKFLIVPASIKADSSLYYCHNFLMFLNNYRYILLNNTLAVITPMSLALSVCIFFLKLEFTPCKAEQLLQGMELQEKEVLKD